MSEFFQQVTATIYRTMIIFILILIIGWFAKNIISNLLKTDNKPIAENYIPDWLAYYSKVLEYKVPPDSIYYEYYPNINVQNGMEMVPQNYENSAYGYWLKI